MATWSTYLVRAFDDVRPWERGTLRIKPYKEKDVWFISPPNDRWWGTAFGSWRIRGECFDGEKWVPTINFKSAAELYEHIFRKPYA